MKFFNKLFFLVISSLTISNIILYSEVSHAGSADLTLTATVEPSAEFDQPIYTSSTPEITSQSGKITQLSWTGTININISGNVRVTTDNPTVSSAIVQTRNLLNYKREYLKLSHPNGTQATIWQNGDASLTTQNYDGASGNLSYEALLEINNNSTNDPMLPAGNYQYSFTLTATPN